MFYGSLIGVLRARPEEASQPILESAWHQVDVDVGNALAHTIIDGHEHAVGSHCSLYCSSEELSVAEKSTPELCREIHHGCVMGPGDEQDMALEHRTNVQECDGRVFFKY